MIEQCTANVQIEMEDQRQNMCSYLRTQTNSALVHNMLSKCESKYISGPKYLWYTWYIRRLILLINFKLHSDNSGSDPMCSLHVKLRNSMPIEKAI